MHLHELTALQREFDLGHAGAVDFYVPITDENVRELEHLLVCLTGEVGELANLAKKSVRGDFLLSERRPEVEKEVADIFIYLLKIAGQMGIDLEAAFLRTLEENRSRFSELRR